MDDWSASSSSLPLDPQNAQKEQRKRNQDGNMERLACQPCTKAKRKCTGERPTCQRCIDRGIEADCSYGVNKRKLKGEERHQSRAEVGGIYKKSTRRKKSSEESEGERIMPVNYMNSMNQRSASLPVITMSMTMPMMQPLVQTPIQTISPPSIPPPPIPLPLDPDERRFDVLPLFMPPGQSPDEDLSRPQLIRHPSTTFTRGVSPLIELEHQFLEAISLRGHPDVAVAMMRIFDASNPDAEKALAKFPPYRKLLDMLRVRISAIPLETSYDKFQPHPLLEFAKKSCGRLVYLKEKCIKESKSHQNFRIPSSNSIDEFPNAPWDMVVRLTQAKLIQAQHAQPKLHYPNIEGNDTARELMVVAFYAMYACVVLADNWIGRAIVYKVGTALRDLGLCNTTLTEENGWFATDGLFLERLWNLIFGLDLCCSAVAFRPPFFLEDNTTTASLFKFKHLLNDPSMDPITQEYVKLTVAGFELWKVVGHAVTLRTTSFPAFEDLKKTLEDPAHPLSDKNWVRNLILGMVESWKKSQSEQVIEFISITMEDVTVYDELVRIINKMDCMKNCQITTSSRVASWSAIGKLMYWMIQAAFLYHHVLFCVVFVAEPGYYTKVCEELAPLLDVDSKKETHGGKIKRDLLEMFVEQQQRQGLDAAVNLLALAATANNGHTTSAANAGQLPFWASHFYQGTHMGSQRVNRAIVHMDAMSRLVNCCLRLDLEYSMARFGSEVEKLDKPVQADKSFVASDVMWRYFLISMAICESSYIVGLLRANPEQWALKVDMVEAPLEIYPLRHHLVLQARGNQPTQRVFQALNANVGRLERQLDALAQYARKMSYPRFEAIRQLILEILDGKRDWLPFEASGMQWVKIDAELNGPNQDLAGLNRELELMSI